MLIVRVSLSPPFVMVDDGQFGLAIELWEDIAKKSELTKQHRRYQKHSGSLSMPQQRADIDIAVTKSSRLPRAREERIRFHSTMVLMPSAIMVRADQGRDIRAVTRG